MKPTGRAGRSVGTPVEETAYREQLKPSTLLRLKTLMFDRYEGALPLVALFALRYMYREYDDNFVKLELGSSCGWSAFERYMLEEFVEDKHYEVEEMWARITYIEKYCRPHYAQVTRSLADSISAWRFLTGAES